MESSNKRIKCRAAVAYGPNQPLIIEDIYVDPPKRHEIRIKIIGSGICPSDLHILDNISSDLIFPLIMGREGSGVVESIGPDIENVNVGDHVIPLWIPNCMECDLCVNRKTNCCIRTGTQETIYVMPDGTTRFWTLDEKPIYKSIGCAAFSEYTVMPKESVVVIDKNVDLEKVCLIGGCIVTGFGNVMNVAKVEEGANVAVFGLEAIGLAAIIAAKELGANRIIGVDFNENKFEIAKKFGCNEFVNPNKLPKNFKSVEQLFQSYGGLDYTFECIGNVSAIKSAFESLNGWGLCVVVGLPPKGTFVSIDPWLLLTGQRLTGSFFGGFKPRKGIQYLIERYLNGSLGLEQFITNKIKLDDINKGIDSVRSRSTIRTVIEFDR